MYLRKITVHNFKNYEDASVSFAEGVNALVGPNGSGKTNLLDAVHYLSLTKSALNSVDSQNVRHGESFFMIKGELVREGKPLTVLVQQPTGQKKVIKVNGAPYDKVSDHIGLLPLVLIAPQDTDLIREGSETRRRFVDGLLSQIDRSYLNTLLQYNHVLKQRNALLKQFAERNTFDGDLLAPYTAKLSQLGEPIHTRRKEWVSQFTPRVLAHYAQLADDQEPVALQYDSPWQTGQMETILGKALEKDRILQRCTVGVHRDDFVFQLGEYPLKKFGSQGQQKSFVIALKLAQYELFQEHFGFPPLLLMDDIFDKLDDGRIQRLMSKVSGSGFGQLLVTDARPERTQAIFQEQALTCQMVHVHQGEIIDQEEV
ncbi:MAG TPA: DNA replication and repair protein RecF [Cytophagales bacterium]|nr:DNA replication and repair protein RecF [Cytophagales bacterium]